MPKKELSKKAEGQLATTEPVAWVMEGADESDQIMPLAVIYQDSAQRDKLGDEHADGTLVDSSTQEALATPKKGAKFVPIYGYKEYIQWGDRDSDDAGILHRTRDLSEVPAGGLDWVKGGGENGKDAPPPYTIHRNFFVLFEGADVPVILSMKSSSKYQTKVAKIINSMMQRRSALKQGPAYFEIKIDEVETMKNNKKYIYWEYFVKFAGDASAEDAATASNWGGVVSKGNVDSNVEEVSTGDDGENIPF